MIDNLIGLGVLLAVLLPPAALIGFYWRRRLRFTAGPGPVFMCAYQARQWPPGLGWRTGIVRLTDDEFFLRRRWTFRSEADLVIPRGSLTLVGRARAPLDAALRLSGGDLLTLATPDRTLKLVLALLDVEIFLDWLGTSAERPPSRFSVPVRIAMWLAGAGITAYVAYTVYGGFWIVLVAALFGFVVLGIAVGVITALVNRRRSLPHVLRDEFVAAAGEVFDFLPDFGFTNAYVHPLPWRTSLAFDGRGTRWLTITIDRRSQRLDLEMGRRAANPESRTLRDVIAEAGHPDPERVRRYTGPDGPLSTALEANAHALKLWARSFLTAEP